MLSHFAWTYGPGLERSPGRWSPRTESLCRQYHGGLVRLALHRHRLHPWGRATINGGSQERQGKKLAQYTFLKVLCRRDVSVVMKMMLARIAFGGRCCCFLQMQVCRRQQEHRQENGQQDAGRPWTDVYVLNGCHEKCRRTCGRRLAGVASRYKITFVFFLMQAFSRFLCW